MEVPRHLARVRDEWKGMSPNRSNKADELSRKDESNLSRVGKKRALIRRPQLFYID